MKNQYFGDINDYKKYSLLRILSGNGQINTVVCWVLTEDDSRTDGNRIGYLQQPERWKSYDPIVYKHLREHVLERGLRDVTAIERADVLPNSRFYKEYIYDDIDLRDEFFDKFFKFAQGADLVFYDPDNGLEVKSVPRGKKKSSKYIYWSEIEASYNSGHSLLIYQHLPRKPRETFIHNIVTRFHTLNGARRVFTYCTDHVVFFLFPQPEHEEHLTDNNTIIADKWGGKIVVCEHSPTRAFYSVSSVSSTIIHTGGENSGAN